jgi:hypothetical protein
MVLGRYLGYKRVCGLRLDEVHLIGKWGRVGSLPVNGK